MLPLAFLRRAFRRSRLRGASVLALESLGEASALDVSLFLGADLRNVEGALVGSGAYRVQDSLVVMGLVAHRVVDGVALYALTERGRWVAVWWRGQSLRERGEGVVVRVP